MNDVFLYILCPYLVIITIIIALCLRVVCQVIDTVLNSFYDYFTYFSVLHIWKLKYKRIKNHAHSYSKNMGKLGLYIGLIGTREHDYGSYFMPSLGVITWHLHDLG